MKHAAPRLEHNPLATPLVLLRILLARLVKQSVHDTVDLDREQLDPDVTELRLAVRGEVVVNGIQVSEGLGAGNVVGLHAAQPYLGVQMAALGVEPVDDGLPPLLRLPVVL